LVRFRLLRYRTFTAGVMLAWVLGFVLYGSLVLLPLFMQTLLGWTAETAGLWTSPRGIGTAALMPLIGYLLSRNWDGRWMLVFGFIATSMAFFGYSTMNLNSGTWDIFWYQVNQGAGMAFVFVPLTTLTMDPIPREQLGYATSLYSVMRNIGSSMGISFVTTLVARRSQFHQSVLSAHVTPYDGQLHQMLGNSQAFFFQGGSDWTTAGQQALAATYSVVQRQAALLSFVEAFRIMGVAFLLCTGFVLLMRRAKYSHGTATDRVAESH
jgi:DHA2 family multidrug resistance protein